MPLRPSVGRSVGWSVCHNFIKGWDVKLQCPYKGTCYFRIRSTDCICTFFVFLEGLSKLNTVARRKIKQHRMDWSAKKVGRFKIDFT